MHLMLTQLPAWHKYCKEAQVLQGVRRHQASTMPPITPLPITIQIMQSIKAALTCNSTDPQNIMMWAARCVHFWLSAV